MQAKGLWIVILTWMALSWALSGCDQGPYGRPCQLDGCPTICVIDGRPIPSIGDDGICAPPCRDDGDCREGEHCSSISRGASACVPDCDPAAGSPWSDWACVGGRIEACYDLGPGEAPCGHCCGPWTSECEVCAPGEYCTAFDDGVCATKAPVGSACEYAAQCASANCSEDGDAVGECLVAHGEPCNGDNCSRCIQTGSGTECHQECSGLHGNCGNCLGSREHETFWCHDGAQLSGGVYTCPDGYTVLIYDDFGVERRACVPLQARFVCGSQSVGAPCE